jgi:putative transposase
MKTGMPDPTEDPAQRYHRRSIRLPGADYAQPGAYFITLVSANRDCLFGKIMDDSMQLSPTGIIADEHWRAIPDHFPNVELGPYVIMPNHIHGVLVITSKSTTPADANDTSRINTVGATQWVAPSSSTPTDVNNAKRGNPTSPTPTIADDAKRGDLPNGPQPGSIGAILGAYKMSVTRRVMREMEIAQIWQRNYYEHIIRDATDWNRIEDYIGSNIEHWSTDDENGGRQ